MQSLSTVASHIIPRGIANPNPRIFNKLPTTTPQQQQRFRSFSSPSSPSLLPVQFSPPLRDSRRFCVTAATPSSVGSEQYVEEPKTIVKFPTSLSLPGCSNSLSLLGTGYREKVFAIIGVKVYAVGFYANSSLSSNLLAWRGKSTKDIEQDGSLFNSIFQASFEKSLRIVLVRDVDGKTFWDALNEAITPRIKTLNSVDEAALSTFRNIFQGRDLKKGTNIFLTWPELSKMLVAVSSEGLPSESDATIESQNVTFALFDVFLGNAPVSPSLKSSVVDGLAAVLK